MDGYGIYKNKKNGKKKLAILKIFRKWQKYGKIYLISFDFLFWRMKN